MDERVLVRRVAVAACVVALLTMPLIRIALGDHESWIAGAHFLVLGLALLGLRRDGLTLGTVFGATAALLLAVTLVSFWTSTGSMAAGRTVVGYGSGPLWLATVMSPLLFLSFPVRRAAWLVVAGGGVVAVAFLVRAGASAGRLLAGGLWFPALAAVLVVCTTTAVALLAERSAMERREAEELRRRSAEERRELASAQRRRRLVFSRTADELRGPMAALRRAVDELEDAPPAASVDAARHVSTLGDAVLREVQVSLRSLVEDAHDRSDEVPADVADGHEHGDEDDEIVASPRGGLLVTALVVVAVLVDGLRLGELVATAGGDGIALAAAGNRMVLVLFLAAAVVAVRRPDRLGWAAVVGALLVHPIAVVSAVAGDATPVLVQTLVPGWRNGLLSTTFIVLLSAIVERRARARDVARREAAADAADSRRLRQQDAAAERTYAEAAHELKNPLAVITAGARTLASMSTLTAEQAAKLQAAIVRSTARLDDRLREMRAVAGHAVEPSDAVASTASPVVVGSLLEHIVAGSAAYAEHGAVDLDVDCGQARVTVVAGHLEQVMENLLGNARAYGVRDVPIRLTARVHDHEVRVDVANRGGTLDRTQAQRVFEPYWRASGAGDPAGSGLGLAIVARLVAGWGGTRWCSVADGWTRVGFTIPLSDVEASWSAGSRVPTLSS